MSGDFKVGVFIGLGILALMIMFLANKPEDDTAFEPTSGQGVQDLAIAEPRPQPATPTTPVDTTDAAAGNTTWDTSFSWPSDVTQPAAPATPAATDNTVVIEEQTDASRIVGGGMTGRPDATDAAPPAEDAGALDQRTSLWTTDAVDTTATDTTAAEDPAPVFPIKHVVAKGETLSAISNRYYGTHKGYYHIYQANRDQMATADSVREGQEILIPAPSERITAAAGRNSAPAPAPVEVATVVEEPATMPTFSPRTHKVRKGDSLCKIAREYYNGDERLWTKILAANRDKVKDPARLPVGVNLVIPPI